MKTDKETDELSADHAGNRRRCLPSLDAMLKMCVDEVEQWGHRQVKGVLTALLEELRLNLAGSQPEPVDRAVLKSRVRSLLQAENSASLKPVFNLTGTVLHTNLGRASLPRQAIDAVVRVAGQPSNLEFDLVSGTRGDRDSHIEKLVCELTGAEAATAVNNNAAAVLLVLNTLAFERDVPVSRGELVEIGGSFRIPEVMRRANCNLVEVGATNRTHLSDYQNALTANTALLMKVHTSNYRVEGFTAEVSEEALAGLAREHSIPFVMDLGSGSLVDFAALGLPAESTAAQVIAAGADLVTFSGDKLLGGPQSGIIAGRRDLISLIKKNPLKRALRLDKMTLAALAEVLKLYRNPARLLQELPALRQLTRETDSIRLLAEQLQPVLAARLGKAYRVTAEPCLSQIGSGALPVDTLPSFALRMSPADQEDVTLRRLAEQLRQLPVPVIGRLHQRSLWLDLRCLDEEATFVEQLEYLAL